MSLKRGRDPAAVDVIKEADYTKLLKCKRDAWKDALYTLNGRTYILKKRLGCGGFGVVFGVYTHPQNEGPYALKFDTTYVDDAKMCKEADIQKRVAETLPQVPRVYECNPFAEEDGTTHMYTLMEMMDGSCADLYDILIKKIAEMNAKKPQLRKAMTTEDSVPALQAITGLVHICREMANQIGKLEAVGIYHIDIKIENMLYGYTKNKDSEKVMRLCLSDYGFACDRSSRFECHAVGTITPPEWYRAGVGGSVLRDKDSIELAQRYIVGYEIQRILNLTTSNLGGPGIYSTVREEAIGHLDLGRLVNIAEGMAKENPEERRPYTYKLIVTECDRLIRFAATVSPHANNIFVRSIEFYP
jgi:serine/threonine protein kinase